MTGPADPEQNEQEGIKRYYYNGHTPELKVDMIACPLRNIYPLNPHEFI